MAKGPSDAISESRYSSCHVTPVCVLRTGINLRLVSILASPVMIGALSYDALRRYNIQLDSLVMGRCKVRSWFGLNRFAPSGGLEDSLSSFFERQCMYKL